MPVNGLCEAFADIGASGGSNRRRVQVERWRVRRVNYGASLLSRLDLQVGIFVPNDPGRASGQKEQAYRYECQKHPARALLRGRVSEAGLSLDGFCSMGSPRVIGQAASERAPHQHPYKSAICRPTS